MIEKLKPIRECLTIAKEATTFRSPDKRKIEIMYAQVANGLALIDEITATLESEELLEEVAQAVRLVNLYGKEDGHEYIEGGRKIAQAAIDVINDSHKSHRP